MKRRDTLMRLKRFRVYEFKRRLGTLDDMKIDLDGPTTLSDYAAMFYQDISGRGNVIDANRSA